MTKLICKPNLLPIGEKFGFYLFKEDKLTSVIYCRMLLGFFTPEFVEFVV
ncbi:MAG: hypothetical protein H7X86_09075 [Gorillibacterium sp.]|nr:hypothetical protein [Gorillibacterium sp.]